MNFKLIANTLAGIAILALVFIYGIDSDYTKENPSAEPDIDSPAWYLIDADVKSFDQTGRLETRSQSSLFEHFEHKDISLAQNPFITNFNSDGSEWYVTADNGKVLPGGNDIELTQNANIRKNTPATLIQSEYFFARTDISFLTTSKPVKITTADSITTAIGLKAYLNDEKVKLLDNVKTTYRQ
jgi:lipopolysaccharide export system protein LptC